ncbi:hypothetical protein GOA77_09150 [Sinorhizobium meliloti]|nr:hypothetical protein [Sinorhizobium meliloti]
MSVSQEDLSSRKAPVIPAQLVELNSAGFVWRELMVRLPTGFIADDLKEPSIWSLVQSSRNSLVRHDRLYIVAYDESWIAEAIVAESGRDYAVLSKPRITQLSDRYTNLFQTEDYRVIWTGTGYCVERKKDSRRMTTPVSSAAIAERELTSLYPRDRG